VAGLLLGNVVSYFFLQRRQIESPTMRNGEILFSSLENFRSRQFTLYNPSSRDMVAKLYRDEPQEPRCTFYIRAECRATVDVPEGVYCLQLTRGVNWDTNRSEFRRRAEFLECNKKVDLTRYHHVTFDLEGSPDGELRMYSLDRSSF
jgi:hypothetical protein